MVFNDRKGLVVKYHKFYDFVGNCFGLLVFFRKLTAVFKCHEYARV